MAKAPKKPKLKKAVKDVTNVSEDRIRRFVSEMVRLTAEKNELVSEIRLLRKNAKDDGVDLKAVDRVMRMAKMTEDEQKREHDITVAYARHLHLPIGTQLSFLSDMPDLSTAMTDEQKRQKWFDHGFSTSLLGGARTENPHLPETAEGVAWFDGYQAQQTERMKGFKSIDPQSDEGKTVVAAAMERAVNRAARNGATPPAPV